MTNREAKRVLEFDLDHTVESMANPHLMVSSINPDEYNSLSQDPDCISREDTIKALEQEPYKIVINGDARANNVNDAWQQGYAQGRKSIRILDKIRTEIAEYKDDKVIHDERNEMIDIVLEIIDRHLKEGSK